MTHLFTPVARRDDIAPDTAKTIEVAGRSILLVHSEGQYYAVENLCSHAAEPLACGRIKRGWIACPAHGARFDLGTGEALGAPAELAIATFPVRIVDGAVEVAV